MIAGSRKGQPLAALALLLATWAGARALLWEPALSPQKQLLAVMAPGSKASAATVNLVRPEPPGPPHKAELPPILAPLPLPLAAPIEQFAAPAPPPAIAPAPLAPPVPWFAPQIAGGHQMLWLAAVSQLPMPASVAAAQRRYAPPTARKPAPQTAALRRWSGDSWVLWRAGGTGFNLPGAGLPGANLPVGTYGASQVGAVLRYRLAPASAHRPAVYLRGAGSIDRPRYQEAALGLSARPLAGLPVAAMAELRATRSFGETRLRPAAALVTELAPVKLPLGARAELYAQAGYVGGKGATAFVDGQLRIERKVARFGPAELSAGGGAWGGTQQGARRLDIGPSASLGFPAGGASARLSADWRFRVGGRAAPTSGPAITLSAGF